MWRNVVAGMIAGLLLSSAVVQARNTRGLPSISEEFEARAADIGQSYVASGCLHGTDADTTVTMNACRAYARDTAPAVKQLRYLEETATRTVVYSAGVGTYWLIARANVSVIPGGWTCTAGTHYCWLLGATQPVIPDAAVLLLKATVAGGAVTVVKDMRRSSPTGVRSVTDALYGADPAGLSDSRAAFQAALTATQDQSGGVVDVPPGTYLLTGSVLVGHRTTLRCAGGHGSVLTASGTITELIRLQVSGEITSSPSVQNCYLNGNAGLASYGITIDTSNGVLITNNLFASFAVAAMRTDPTRDGNIDHGSVRFNHVQNPETAISYGLPVSSATPTTFIATPANGSTLDLYAFEGNSHGRVITWCYILDTAQRITIRDQWCGNNVSAWTGAILIKNTGEVVDPERNADQIVIDDLHLENSSAIPTPIGVEVDCNYSVAGTAGRQRRHQFRNIRTGQTGTTDNILVRIGISGTNCIAEQNEIFWPKQDYGQANLRIIIGTGVTDTRILAADSNSKFETILQNTGDRTTVNGMLITVPASSIKANRPVPEETGRGIITGTNDGTDSAGFPQMRYWTADKLGNVVHLGGGTVQVLQTILTSADQFEELGRLVAHTTVLRASLFTTEAWNSAGTDEIRCGTGAEGAVNTQIFALTDVSTTGTDVPTVGSRGGPSATATTYNCEYINGGAEPTTGKTLVIVEFLNNMAVP